MPHRPGEAPREPPAWHRLSAAAAAERLGADLARGLDEAEALARRQQRGPNEIVGGRRRSLPLVFLGQLRDFMIVVLLLAALVSGLVGAPEDSLAILVIVLLNALVGTVQEFRAERAIAALRSLAQPTARVLRSGTLRSIPLREVVDADVVEIEAGDLVPADLRLAHCFGLEIDESTLTGESVPVAKRPEALETERPALGDRANMAYRGTRVTRGRALGLVVATGMQTELGRIASLLRDRERDRTPLQRRLARFGRRLALGVMAICALIFAAGLLRGDPPLLMFLTAVSLAVAAIPEALPAVVTVSLALGARSMSRRRALVRRLPAVETLGSVTTICADKTGTLTQNRMQVEEIRVEGAEPLDRPCWRRLWQALALCNNVAATPAAAGSSAEVGEPTEVALTLAAAAAGFERAACLAELPRLTELPFAAERKRMSTVHRDGAGALVFTKGAPEAVIPSCSRAARDGATGPIDPEAWLERAEQLAARGLRVLAIAVRELAAPPPSLEPDAVESELCLLGLVGLLDPPREGAEEAVQSCLSAGIAPVMITGDHPGTALAIAQRLGMAQASSAVMTGPELERASPEELERLVEDVRIYARVDPEQKTKIVHALQRRGRLVAMTGDGVNDAPALEHADIGVAMGRKGTDVAREAADMVLLDDDFATIVAAVREGRRIYDNIRKFVSYTMTSNSGEIWTLLLAPFLGLPIPLLPIHILWINLVTDGLPGLALSAEPAERDVMQRPPRAPDESIFARGLWQHMLWMGLLIAGLSLLSQAWALREQAPHWQTVVFTVLTLCQLVHAVTVRSEAESLWRTGLRGNPALLGAVTLTVGLQLAVVYLPGLRRIFHTQALPPADLAVCFGLALMVLVASEIEKLVLRRRLPTRPGSRPGITTGC